MKSIYKNKFLFFAIFFLSFVFFSSIKTNKGNKVGVENKKETRKEKINTIETNTKENEKKRTSEIQTNIKNTRRKKRIASRNTSKYQMASSLKDGGSGSIYSLTNHNINCGSGSALTGFHLWGKFGFFSNDNAYEWNCFKHPRISNEQLMFRTPPVKIKDAKDSSNRLAFLPVNCMNGFVLARFQLKKEGNAVYYEYNCTKAELSPGVCTMQQSKWVDAGWAIFGLGSKSVTELDKLYLQVPAPYAITGFSLIYRKDNKQIAYITSACEIDDKPPIPWPDPIYPPIPKPDEMKRAEGRDGFNGLQIDCGDDKIIGFVNFEEGAANYLCVIAPMKGGKIINTTPFMDLTLLMCPPQSALSGMNFYNSDFGLSIDYTCSNASIGIGMNEQPDDPESGNVQFLLSRTNIKAPKGHGITMVRWEPHFGDGMSMRPPDLNRHRCVTVTAPLEGKKKKIK